MTHTVKFARTAHIDPDAMYTVPAAAVFLGFSRQTTLREIKRRGLLVQVIDRAETAHKKGFRTIRIQGAVIIELLNAMEKRL